MGKSIFRKLCLILLPLTMVISSCSGTNNKTKLKQDLPDISIKEEEFKDLDFAGEQIRELDIANPDAFKSTYKDVSPDFTIYLKYSGVRTLTSFSNDEEMLIITDISQKTVGYTATLNNGTNCFTVEPDTPYERGGTYKVDLKTEIFNFMVERTLDHSVRTIYFNVKEEDKSVIDLVDNIKAYPLENVLQNTEPLDPHPNLLYKGDVSLKSGDVVKFENSNANDTYKNDTVFAKVVSTKKEGHNTRVSYVAPETKEVFNNLDIHVDDKKIPLNNFHLNSKEEIYKQLLNSDLIQDYVAQTAYIYNFADNNNAVVDFIKSCKISISFKFIDVGISLQINFLFTHKFSSGWVLSLNVTGQWQQTYTVSADAEVEKFLGIPYWVDMSIAADMTNKFSVTAAVAMTHSTFNPGPELEDPSNVDLKQVKQNVANLKEKWQKAGMFDSYHDKTESGLTLFNIGYVDFYLGYVTFSIELYLTVASNISISLGAGWTHESTSTIISYSTNNGNKTDGSSSPHKLNTHVISGEFIGKFDFEIGAKVRFGFAITGLKWLAQLTLDVDGRFYLEITGFGAVMWDLVTGDWQLDVGFKIEIGFKFSVTLAVVILGTGYGNWEIFSKKFPFVSLGNTNRVQEHIDTEVVNLKKKETKIDDTNTMWFNVLDGLSMSVTPKRLSFDEELTVLDSVFISNPISVRLVDSYTSNSPYLDIVGNKYVIKDNAPNMFDATATLKVSDVFGSFDHTYTISIHYQNEQAKLVDFDGKDAAAYLEGEVVDFPIGEPREGYIFKGWKLNGQRIALSAPYKMGKEDLHFEADYIPDAQFLVEYYDGFNKLVASEWVTNEEAAHGPNASERDINMAGYRFIGWDVDISCVKGNMKVHGIYARIGEVD